MNYSTYRFTLDLRKHQSQMSISVVKDDTAVKLLISLTDGGKPYYVGEGATAILYGKRADGEPLIHRCMIKDNTEIIYKFEGTTTCVEGVVDCQLRLYGADKELITAPKFTIVVDERLINDDDVEIPGVGSPISALDALFEFKAEMEKTLAEIEEWNDRLEDWPKDFETVVETVKGFSGTVNSLSQNVNSLSEDVNGVKQNADKLSEDVSNLTESTYSRQEIDSTIGDLSAILGALHSGGVD